jgi:hypothetical protein
VALFIESDRLASLRPDLHALDAALGSKGGQGKQKGEREQPAEGLSHRASFQGVGDEGSRNFYHGVAGGARGNFRHGLSGSVGAGSCACSRLRRRHSAVESAINALEVHGLDQCPDHGICGFERYLVLAVAARNIHRLGTALREQEKERLKRKRGPYKKAA